MTFGNSRARAISLEYKNTMFKYIYTLKCGGEKNIYFTEHDIYFTKLMFILKNINLELKSALRTKYIFYRILLYARKLANCDIFGKELRRGDALHLRL